MRNLPLVCLACLLLSACGDTGQAIKDMNASIASARQDAARQTAERLKLQPDLLAQGDVQLFLSSRLIGDAARLLEGFKIPVPEREDITVEVTSVSVEFSAGVAGIRLGLQAAKGELRLDLLGLATVIPQPLEPAKLEITTSTISLFGVASISIPEFTLRQPKPMRLKVFVSHLAPSASWGPFKTDIKGLVAEIAQLKINEALNKALPDIQIPVSNIIRIAQPAQTREFPIKEGAYIATLTTPPVSWAGTFDLRDVLILPRGMHLIGDLAVLGETP
ncbi:hypothetical protein PS3A_19220 [Pseudomonas sp. 3A(2025)]